MGHQTYFRYTKKRKIFSQYADTTQMDYYSIIIPKVPNWNYIKLFLQPHLRTF